MRITDISVSRCHACIVLNKGTVQLVDTNSKFGTLVLSKDPLILSPEIEDTGIALQIGRTVLEFSLKKSWKLFPLCYSNENDVVSTTPIVNRPTREPSQVEGVVSPNVRRERTQVLDPNRNQNANQPEEEEEDIVPPPEPLPLANPPEEPPAAE